MTGVQVLKETYHIDFLNLENGIDGKGNSTYHKSEKCKKDILNNLNNKDINKSINVETPTQKNEYTQFIDTAPNPLPPAWIHKKKRSLVL